MPTPTPTKLTGLMGSLRCSQLFMGLGEDDLRAIASFVRVVPLSKGQYLFHEGDPSMGFYLTQSGAVSVHRVSASGKERVIHVFRAGEAFAEAALASPTGYPAAAKAIEPSTVLLVPKEPILELLGRRPDLALRMLGSLGGHLRVLVGMLDDLTLKDVESRLLNWLVRRAGNAKSPRTVPLPGTKRVLASELGTSGETLSRTLARLRQRGLVRVGAKAIEVPAPHALAEALAKNLGEGGAGA